MQILQAVVVVNVENGQTVSQLLDVLLDIAVSQVCVTDVQTEAEIVTACLVVEQVDHAASVGGVGQSTLDDAIGTAGEDILQTNLNTLVFLDFFLCFQCYIRLCFSCVL